jgi:hypothetical protein
VKDRTRTLADEDGSASDRKAAQDESDKAIKALLEEVARLMKQMEEAQRKGRTILALLHARAAMAGAEQAKTNAARCVLCFRRGAPLPLPPGWPILAT